MSPVLVSNAASVRDDVQEILRYTAAYYRLRVEQLLTRSRTRHVARARQVAMYLLCHDVGLSLLEAGYVLGRDHTTVLYGVRTVSRSVREHGWALEAVTQLRDTLNHSRTGTPMDTNPTNTNVEITTPTSAGPTEPATAGDYDLEQRARSLRLAALLCPVGGSPLRLHQDLGWYTCGHCGLSYTTEQLRAAQDQVLKP